MSLTWTSPIRRRGRVLLPAIPNEIYLEIFSYLKPDPEAWIDVDTRHILCNLALVCRFFSSLMLPWIFENITFVDSDPYTQSHPTMTSTVSAQFCRSVLDRDATALLMSKYIKRCAFFSSPVLSRWSPVFFSLYFETVKHMPNLLQLSLTYAVIPKVFFRCIPNIPQLETMKLDCCSLDGVVEEKHLKKFSGLKLKSLVLRDASNLHRLLPYLNMSYLLRLELKTFANFDSLPVPSQNLPLEFLSLDSIQVPFHLYEFLKKTPSLKSLRVSFPSPGPASIWPESKLETIHAPVLAEIEANWPLCQTLIPGRPISSLKLGSCSTEMGIKEIQIMKKSTCPITSLKVPCGLYLKVPLVDHFPSLRRLKMDEVDFQAYRCNAWDQMVNELISKWDRHPDLHFLTIEFSDSYFIRSDTIDLDEMKSLMLLTSAFPALINAEFIHLRSCCCCIYTRNRSESTAWHRTVNTLRLP